MKAVIVDIEGGQAIALNKKGDFLKIKYNSNYQIGQEVEVNTKKVFNFPALMKVLPAAAAFLVLASLSLASFAYTRPYSYVDVDINPSIEITSNIFDRIIKVEGLNVDGKNLLSDSSFNNMNINDGIEDILKAAVSHGYLVSSSTSAVMLTVSGKNDQKVDKIENEIQKTVNIELKNVGSEAEVLVENVTLQRHEEAIKQGISPGKLLLIDRLIKVNPDVKVEDYRNAPVKEIMREINSNKERHKEGLKNKKIDEKDNEAKVKDDESKAKDNINTNEKTDKTDNAEKQKQRKILPGTYVKDNENKSENSGQVKDNTKGSNSSKRNRYEKNTVDKEIDEEIDKEVNDSKNKDKKQDNGKIKNTDIKDRKDREKN